METNTLSITFTGSDAVVVEAFLFTCDNVIMRTEDKDDQAACLSSYVDGEACRAYLSKSNSGWLLTEKGRDYDFLCNWLVDRYAKPTDPEELTRTAMNTHLDRYHFIRSLITIDEMYIGAELYDRASYGELPKVLIEHSTLSKLLLLKRPVDYQFLKEAIAEHVHNCESFVSNFSFNELHPVSSEAAVETMKDDVKEIETRLDFRLEMLTAQFDNLTLTLKKTAESEKPSIMCLYCQKKRHYSNQCRQSPMIHTRCGRRDEICHTTETCFQKQMNIPKNRTEVQNKTVGNNFSKEPENRNQPAELVAVVEEAEPFLSTKSDDEGTVVSKRQKTDEFFLTPPLFLRTSKL